MNKRAIKFRDVWVAPGSECFAALESGDTAKAVSIVDTCDINRIALERGITVDAARDVWRKQRHPGPGPTCARKEGRTGACSMCGFSASACTLVRPL